MIDFFDNVVFNVPMLRKHPDSKLISDLGGPAKVAELLKFPKLGGQQRVHNWQFRGIPAQVKLDNLELLVVGKRHVVNSDVHAPEKSAVLPGCPPVTNLQTIPAPCNDGAAA